MANSLSVRSNRGDPAVSVDSMAATRFSGAASGDGEETLLPSPADVVAAAKRVRDHVHRTPLLTSTTLDRLVGRRIFLKAEHLQKTGSYKARGAINHVVTLGEADAGVRGVVAASSGNHGQAVAWAAAQRDLPATIVVPRSIAAGKRAAIEGYGAKVVVVGESSDERLAKAQELAARQDFYEIPPYDHPLTIAGQGTLALEACEQLQGEPPEAMLVAVSGGGLAAGCALALAHVAASVLLYGVEPAGADDTRQSLAAGTRVVVEPQTIADALRARQPGQLTFEVNRLRLTDVLVAEDSEIVAAVRFLWERCKQVVEWGGATALAAVLAGRVPGDGPLLVVLSGGNLSVETLAATYLEH
jgi:threo-3-hydroxy-L-aspartate ammonia-lyase